MSEYPETIYPDEPKVHPTPAPRLKNLTHKQALFCEEYMRDHSVMGAYVRAGFKSKHANSNAYRLFKTELVQKRIEELKAIRAAENALTVNMVRDRLVEIATNASKEGRHSAAIRAWELLGKYLGMFVERSQVHVTSGRTQAEVDAEIAHITKVLGEAQKD